MDNINVNQAGTTPVATEEINGIHYQKVIPVSETGEGVAEMQLNWLSRALFKVFGRFSFDNTSQLRTAVSGSVSVSFANTSIGDTGKASTVQLQSAQCFYGTVGANFARS